MNTHSKAWRPSPEMVSICACLGVMLLAGLGYQRVLFAGFSNQDDLHYLFEVGDIWSFTRQEVTETVVGGRIHRPSGTSGYYQPLVAVSFMIDALVTGSSDARWFQFHLTNLFLHVMNVGLVFLLCRKFSNRILWPVLLALLFAFHPVQVESVAWITQRMTLLGAMFSLAALYCYVQYVNHPRTIAFTAAPSADRKPDPSTTTRTRLESGVRPGLRAERRQSPRSHRSGGGATTVSEGTLGTEAPPEPTGDNAAPAPIQGRPLIEPREADAFRPRWLWLAPVVPLYAAAVLSRPLFIGLPIVLLLLDIWPFRRSTRWALIEKLPLLGVMLAGVSVLIAVHARGQAGTVSAAVGVGPVSRNIASFAARIVWPFGLSPYQPLSTTVAGVNLGVAFDVALCLLILLALFWSFRRCKPIFTALAGAVVLVSPALLQVPWGGHSTETSHSSPLLLGDQYLYAALVVPLVAFAAYLRSSSTFVDPRISRVVPAILSLGVITLFSILAYAQTGIWRSSRDLYLHTTKRFPEWAFGYVGLVESHIRGNNFEAALSAAQQAVKIERENPSTQFYLGTVLLLHDNPRSGEAVEPLRKALSADPNWIECLQNLGVALARSGRLDEAIEYFERARDLKPNSAGIRVGLGNAYLKVRRFASARCEFQEALKRRNSSAAHLGLAIAWAANDMPDLARRHLSAAVAREPEIARRAGRSEHLLRLRDRPGFNGLLEIPAEMPAPEDISPAELPTARRAHGS